MTHTKYIERLITAVIFTVLFSCFAFAQGTPSVSKIEPPNWWTGHSINPVRVLLRGQNLTGAKVEAVGGGLTIGLVRTNATGTYLFVDVSIDPAAKAGRRTLKLSTKSGNVDVPFDIFEPLARRGRFQGFSSDDVVYLIMPDRFDDGDTSNDDPAISKGLYDRSKSRFYHGGDIEGIIKRLPYLKDLGITAIWLNPWYDNVNHLNERETYPEVEGGQKKPITDYHGYGAVDYYGVEEHFGTLATLRDLVDAAHKLGIKVIQDQVSNHTGPFHPWTTDAPTATWYHGTTEKHPVNRFQPWTVQDPNARYEDKQSTLDGWFVDILPDMNQSDEEVARYEIQNTLWWAGMTGIDGIRQDTWPYVPTSFWRDWMAAIKREYPSMTVVGEMMDGDPALVSFFQGGRTEFDGIDDGVDSMFDYPLLFTIRSTFAGGKPIKDVAQMLARDHMYPAPAKLMTFIGNHDIPRFMNEPGADVVGLKLANTFLLTTRGIPQLYYGDEIAMRGAGDPDNRRDFPGGFASDKRNAFTKIGRTPEENDVFEHLRKLLHLREEIEPLRRGDLLNLYIKEQQYAYARRSGNEAAVIVFNNDVKPAAITFDVSGTGLENDDRLVDRLGVIRETRVTGGTISVTMPARSASILVVRKS